MIFDGGVVSSFVDDFGIDAVGVVQFLDRSFRLLYCLSDFVRGRHKVPFP